jgi:enamine deaminase RidA (YjgF/YER057c/UK114 family)
MDVWAMRGAGGERLPREHVRDEGGRLAGPYSSGLRCESMIFAGGHLPIDGEGRVVHPGDLNAQTRRVMESTRQTLGRFGAGLDHMVKQTSFYLGGADPATIVTNQTLRSSYYAEPAGASTGVPLPFFAVEGVMVTVETIAMLD